MNGGCLSRAQYCYCYRQLGGSLRGASWSTDHTLLSDNFERGQQEKSTPIKQWQTLLLPEEQRELGDKNSVALTIPSRKQKYPRI